MTIAHVPHRPSAEEHEAALSLALPADAHFADQMLAAAGKAFARSSYLDALNILKGIVITRPDDARVYEALGVLYRAWGARAAAVRCFEEALLLDSNAPHANVNLGELTWNKSKDAAAARGFLDRIASSHASGPIAERAQVTLRRIARQS
jgi:Flp pilus assembly protein TadD